MNNMFSDNSLKFTPLFNASPYIFIRSGHPLADKKSIKLKELEQFPFVTFDQGESRSMHFSEETLNISQAVKSIKVNDRATLLNLLVDTDSYTVSARGGISDLKDNRFKSISVEDNQIFTIGWVTHKDISLSEIAKKYILILNDLISENYFDLNFYLL